jgi:hypothetical protein
MKTQPPLIELQAIVQPLEIACPHCGEPLLRMGEHDVEVVGGGFWLEDGDTVLINHALNPAQREGFGWKTRLDVGSSPCCEKQYVVITATFAKGLPDDEFINRYFQLNEDRGRETNFVASSGDARWYVTRFESRLGPVLEHQFGPFAWNETSWIGRNGVSACTASASEKPTPFDFARDLLLEHWDSLRTLTMRYPEPQTPSDLTNEKVPNKSGLLGLDDEIPF